jgi:hypothetical protein
LAAFDANGDTIPDFVNGPRILAIFQSASYIFTPLIGRPSMVPMVIRLDPNFIMPETAQSPSGHGAATAPVDAVTVGEADLNVSVADPLRTSTEFSVVEAASSQQYSSQNRTVSSPAQSQVPMTPASSSIAAPAAAPSVYLVPQNSASSVSTVPSGVVPGTVVSSVPSSVTAVSSAASTAPALQSTAVSSAAATVSSSSARVFYAPASTMATSSSAGISTTGGVQQSTSASVASSSSYVPWATTSSSNSSSTSSQGYSFTSVGSAMSNVHSAAPTMMDCDFDGVLDHVCSDEVCKKDYDSDGDTEFPSGCPS